MGFPSSTSSGGSPKSTEELVAEVKRLKVELEVLERKLAIERAEAEVQRTKAGR
jgi:hypothetical protein